ncbi:MAG: hypothetical protein E3K36_14570 [Candidatus Brocadia sp.]|nr:hypothetical protein [Candidatus Brocadia sp.]
MSKAKSWIPFRPNSEDLRAIAEDVSEVQDIQRKLLNNHKDLHLPDRVAHQYQIAGSKVVFKVADVLPSELEGVGLFEPKAEYFGIGRISTGLGMPHIETNPDFLGIMVAFQTKDGHRVDFLGINDPTAPTDNHRDFIDVLHATAASAGAKIPLIGDWGEYDIGNLLAEQKEFAIALKERMGWLKAGKTLAHIVKQTIRTFNSSTAYQTYWTGIEEVSGRAGKFTLVPTHDENRRPEFRPGERHFSEDWKKRQGEGDIEFLLYWIPFLSEDETPTRELTDRWEEGHKKLVGTITFPKTGADSEEARMWAILASEMGANPGNWVHDRKNSVKEPATEFGTARKIAYERSQKGRNALESKMYQSVFETGQISPDLASELTRRRDEKEKLGHVSWAH